ncbi:MAG: hypothetical protein ABI759_09840 [Candidatus Solibacter sp.]
MFALLLLFAAAGTSPAGAPRVTLPKAAGACSAVTTLDVERALRRSVGRGQEETHAAESVCDYRAGTGLVSVTIQHLRQKLDLAAEIASLTRNIEGATVRMAEGLGATAFYLDIEGAGTQLHVVRDDGEYVMLSVLGFGDAAQVSPAAERLVRIALGRL